MRIVDHEVFVQMLAAVVCLRQTKRDADIELPCRCILVVKSWREMSVGMSVCQLASSSTSSSVVDDLCETNKMSQREPRGGGMHEGLLNVGRPV